MAHWRVISVTPATILRNRIRPVSTLPTALRHHKHAGSSRYRLPDYAAIARAAWVDCLADATDTEYLIIDSAIVRAHPDDAGAPKKGAAKKRKR